MSVRGRSLAAVLLAAAMALAACGTGGSGGGGGGADDRQAAASDSVAATVTPDQDSAGQDSVDQNSADQSNADQAADVRPAPAPKGKPLRKGERRVTLRMPEPYTPSAPNGVGTDDYRCFTLDPELTEDAYLTGTQILPGNPDVVHHVIMFSAPPSADAYIEQMDAADEGPGWTCFGQTTFGSDPVQALDDAPWLGAWAPGGREAIAAPGYGRKLTPGTRIVLQVHYNLLAGAQPDVSGIRLRLAPGDRDLTGLHTMLLPGPVELPCRPGRSGSELCARDAAMNDVRTRFGALEGSTNDALYVLCGGKPKPSETTACTRPVSTPMTIRAAAGHMHLLGRSIKIEVNPDTPSARTVLDIGVWDFDDQDSRVIDPIRLEPFETIRVTCRHAQWLRDRLPAFEAQREDRYVVWGEGTTDEMCLGVLTVTRP